MAINVTLAKRQCKNGQLNVSTQFPSYYNDYTSDYEIRKQKEKKAIYEEILRISITKTDI